MPSSVCDGSPCRTEMNSRPCETQSSGSVSWYGMCLMKDIEGRGRDKTGLVGAAVMFATGDHSTTCTKGGAELLC